MLSLIIGFSRVIGFLKKKLRLYQDLILDLPSKFLYNLGVSPDLLSVVSMLLIFLSAVLIFMQNKYYLITLPLAMFFDLLDGTLARKYLEDTSGALFDFFSDRFSDSMMILAFAASGMLDYYLALTLLFFYVVSTLLSKSLESLKIKVYIISFRIFTVFALFLQELHPKALFIVCSLLLINYAITALFAFPKIIFRSR